ncbi:uncharacterized protein N7473_001793 [Penicillium subrubescens]|uniref:SnoaL-like domain-containing protein n=1 Tax=Penicillium subrubescens TaxID=1316194 RepID=A0A1Q5U2M0_9EURO|nr:uncharacterized protein N7473_001793 [Penicillium subrubescens]KAJ5904877.1 hypothetical protein N7473_001793 [Penicillium subrubescens]OKP06707.1 hypothetical protein PENSUB_6203 [Penicillium subrubescens]
MSHKRAWPFATKSIRSVSDLENYLEGLNTNDPLAFTPYYAPDAIFKWSGQPDRSINEFLDWVLDVHIAVTEKLSLRKAIFNGDGTVIAAEVTMQFQGNGNFETDNFVGKWGPVWPGNGPLVRAYVWYTLDKDGHIIEAIEDAHLLKAATRPSRIGKSLL